MPCMKIQISQSTHVNRYFRIYVNTSINSLGSLEIPNNHDYDENNQRSEKNSLTMLGEKILLDFLSA